MLIAGVTRQNGNLAQHGKDIDYVIDEANRRKLFLPITSAVHEFYHLSRSLGFGPNSSHDMWAVWEKLLGVDLTATIRK
jgi:3-hydroxyisobutyrate dehydrogenase-like beta-hydroxyacid dehydrogenase